MKTSTKTVVKMEILLDPEDMFVVKPPRGWRTWRVNLIEVSKFCFYLYGEPSRQRKNLSSCLPIRKLYLRVDEVPSMPGHVMREVNRCLAEMRALETAA